MFWPVFLIFICGFARLFASCGCTVMGFNIEDGGGLVSLSQVIHVIRSVNPDIVCIQEAEGRVPYIAQALGWPYYNSRMRVISHYPIIDPPEGKGVYVFVEMEPGKVVAVSNVHLPSDPYGPYLFHEGKSNAYVKGVEHKVRLAALKRQLQILPDLAADGVPTFLVGDFNAPSYLDSKRGFKWPVSHELAKIGFRDSYREVHRSVKKEPGFTWWAARPKVAGWNPDPKDPHDRIDFIYVNGPAKTVGSTTIGAKDFSPWPSDHRVVVSHFLVEPSNEPVFVAVSKRLLDIGERLIVRYNAPQKEDLTLAIFSKDKRFFPQKIKKSYYGTLEFKTKTLKPGSYEVRLSTRSGKVLSQIPFTLKRSDEKPLLILPKKVFAYKEPITVSWKHAPGHHLDWISITHDDSSLMAAYTQSEISGSYTFDSTTQFGWPLPAGDYQINYFLDDSKRAVTSLSFTVK